VDITLKNQNGLDATLHIKLEPADYEAEFGKKLDEYRKKATLPGFRTGKAPIGLVKKMIGNDMRHDVVEHVLQHKIDEYLKENNIKVVLQPLSTLRQENIDWSKDNFEFSYDLGMRPEVKIDMEMLNNIPMYEISTGEEDLEKEIKALRKQHGKADTIDAFSDEQGMMAYVKFTELDENGEVLEGGAGTTKLIGASEMPEKLKSLVVGKDKEFKQVVNIHDILTNDELKEYLNVEEAALNDIDKMEIELVNVFKVEDAPLDQELFDKIFEPGTITNEEAFREEYKKLMAAYFNRESENEWISRMKDKLVEGTELELPENMLRRYLLLSYEKEKESEIEDFDKKLDEFRQEMKWVILSDFVAEEHDIQVSEEDIINYTMDMLRNEFSKMGMGELDEATLRQYGINYLSRENNYVRTKMALRDGKVFEQLLSQATPVKEKIDREKFEELTRRKPQ
jgi:trigger factor